MRRLLILLVLLFPAIANAQYNCGANCGGGGGSTPHNILSSTHPDTTPDTIARGDTVVVKGSPLTWWRLPLGTQYKTLQANATDAVYDAVHLDQAPAITGILPKLNLPTTTLFTDQSNAISTGDQDFSAAASLKLPLGAGLQPTVSARIGYDSTANRLGFGLNGVYKLIVTPDSADSLTGKTYNGLTVTTSTGTLTVPNGAVSTLPAGAHSLAPLDAAIFTGQVTIPDFTLAAHSHLNAAGGGLLTPTAAGLGNVTNDVQTKAAIVPNTAPLAGQHLVGNGTAYAPVTVSGSGATITQSSAGVISISNIADGSLASTFVKTIGITTANGVSGSSSGGAAPSLTVTLGAISPSSVAIGAGSAITSSGLGGVLGSNAFNSTAFVPQTTTVNGKALGGNISLASGDLSDTANIPLINAANVFSNALNSFAGVGIGFGSTTPPAGPLLVVATTVTTSPRGIASMQFSSDTNGARLGFFKARGDGSGSDNGSNW
jgi:hypothetical protein